MNDSTVVIRTVDESARTQLIAEDIHPLMARIFAARGIENKSGLDTSFAALLPFKDLSGCAEAARLQKRRRGSRFSRTFSFSPSVSQHSGSCATFMLHYSACRWSDHVTRSRRQRDAGR